ncbi:MAG TPA: hypothetical protein VHL34_02860 [Rhizomicrobium sp.]|nr:hypothetical protein [Rhizomicrobium sp.]
MSDPLNPPARDRAKRKAQNHFQTYEDRTTLVKQIVADEAAASAAKTAKLRALRLAKEEADRLEAAANPPAPAKKKKKVAAK